MNKGTPYESWVNANRERLNLTLLAFDTQPDAVQAVIQGRAHANLSGNTVIRYSASRTPQFIADFVLPGTRFHWATPFRRDSGAMRNQVEEVIECMKLDGTIARIAERTTPFSEDTIPSGEAITAVLEVKGGLMRELGIAVGDRLRQPQYFRN